jgi:hypothetical protein
MKKITKHIAIPLILPIVFFVVASLPVELLGCRNRGLIAALFALAAGILAIILAVRALIGKVRGDTNSFWWMATALILAIPTIYFVLIVF